jgi:hypothetical protein
MLRAEVGIMWMFSLMAAAFLLHFAPIEIKQIDAALVPATW